MRNEIRCRNENTEYMTWKGFREEVLIFVSGVSPGSMRTWQMEGETESYKNRQRQMRVQ